MSQITPDVTVPAGPTLPSTQISKPAVRRIRPIVPAVFKPVN